MPESTRLSRWAPRLVALIVVLIGAGFCFHTSFDPSVLGKYGLGYFVALCMWFLVLVPCVFLLTRYIATPTRVELRSGRLLVITPRTKLITTLVVIAALDVLAWQLIRKRIDQLDPYLFHPYLQTAYKPNHASLGINRWGFRGEEIERDKKPSTFRIFFFGGSTTACVESTFEKTHCRLLELRLRRQYQSTNVNIEVQNLGVPWHCTEHSLIKLFCHIQDFAPDLVIFDHAINDLVRGFHQPQFTDGPYRDDFGNYLGPVAGLVKGRLFDINGLPLTTMIGYWFSDFRFDRVRLRGPEGEGIAGVRMVFIPKARPVQIEQWRSLEAYERNLRSFIDFAKLRGYKVLVTSEPSIYRDDLTPREREVILMPMLCQENGQQPDIPSMARGMAAFNARAQQVAADRHVHFLDLDKMIPKNFDYFFDDVHYTTKGNIAVADAVADEIIKWGVIPARIRPH